MAIKFQTAVQTSTFSADFTSLKKAIEKSVILRQHLISMGIKVSKHTPIFLGNTSVVLNVPNTGSTLNKKTVALRCRFFRGHVSNNFVEVMGIHTINNFSEPFTKLW